MTLPGSLIEYLHYHRWATARIMDEVTSIPAEKLVTNLKGSFPSLYDTLVHLYQSDRIWLDRLEGRPAGKHADYEAPGCMWELKDAWLPVQDRMIEAIQKLDESELDRELPYKNLAGQPFKTPLWEVFSHVVSHGTHHRGQVTMMMRQLGYVPKNIDLINYFRTASTLVG